MNRKNNWTASKIILCHISCCSLCLKYHLRTGSLNHRPATRCASAKKKCLLITNTLRINWCVDKGLHLSWRRKEKHEKFVISRLSIFIWCDPNGRAYLYDGKVLKIIVVWRALICLWLIAGDMLAEFYSERSRVKSNWKQSFCSNHAEPLLHLHKYIRAAKKEKGHRALSENKKK